jgi:pimeloyl-ACP methyl ester carboxylesterase
MHLPHSRSAARRLAPLVPLTLVLTWLALPATLPAQHPPGQSPPPGLAVPEAERSELVQAASKLQAELDQLLRSPALAPDLKELQPDIEIFPKAVLYALNLNEIFDLKQLPAARQLLEEGRKRLEALKSGSAPWTKATGLVVRGFRSKIDLSVQPYGLFIPEDFPAKGGRMDIWLHGRSDTLTELSFLSARLKSKGEFTPPKTLVLHPYGRFCNAYKFAGETDVLEAMESAISRYGVSRDHLALRGFSMGGAGCWHLSAHFPGLWAAAAPGAGFVETAQYAKVFEPGKTPPPWWEQVLWHQYDVPDYTANLTNRPLFLYSGELDAQKQAADKMAAALKALGTEVPHLIGPGTGHKYHPETKEALNRLVDEATQRGRPAAPESLRFETYTLRYHTVDWVRIDALTQHWEHASVEAAHKEGGRIEVKTQGVSALTLTPPKDWATKAGWKIILDDQTLALPKTAEELAFRRIDKKWIPASEAPAKPAGSLQKSHRLQGPIDDAFTDSFVFVRPTGPILHPQVAQWASLELATAIEKWRINFRGEARVIADVDVTPELMKSANLVLWGDPQSNQVLARLLPQLPIQWNQKELVVAGVSYDPATRAPVLIYPNPEAPDRYLVLNSCYTFRNGSNETNALQTPKLPDWAVVDLQTPPDHRAPGRIEDAGFFDEAWLFPKKH